MKVRSFCYTYYIQILDSLYYLQKYYSLIFLQISRKGAKRGMNTSCIAAIVKARSIAT